MNGAQVEAAWDDSAEAKGRPSFGQLAMGLVPVPRTADDRLYVLDAEGQATEVRRPAVAPGGVVTSSDQQQWGYDPAGPTPAPSRRIRPLLASLPPGVADQIERAASECASPTDVDGDVLYAACWCDDGAHAFSDRGPWHGAKADAERHAARYPYPEPHITQTQITEVTA